MSNGMVSGTEHNYSSGHMFLALSYLYTATSKYYMLRRGDGGVVVCRVGRRLWVCDLRCGAAGGGLQLLLLAMRAR